ncbi:MAG: hypothetical protein AB8H79_14275 [Myxococcota bacterium]
MRSPAAQRVAALAGTQGLGLFHYEWRHHLDLPEAWAPEHSPELAARPMWAGGVLGERKYQSFRHDQAIGGYHPGMRAKWATHELCHGLVGFAWHPGASPLFVATASRLAEMVPVVLWYFLDEAHLRRCPVHQNGGALYRRLCSECESAAGVAINPGDAETWLEKGRLFVEAELRAVARTVAEQRPVPHVYGSLNLCSDGVAYASAHGPRIRSAAFEAFVDGFAVPGGGYERTLEALQERATDVLRSIVSDHELKPLAPTPELGRHRWMLQDVGWRLLSLREDTDGEVYDALTAIVAPLAQACQRTATSDGAGEDPAGAVAAVQGAFTAFQALFEQVVLPEPSHLFALGYPVADGLPHRALDQVEDGVTQALPLTAGLLAQELRPLVERFAEADAPVRSPLGRRFAAFLTGGVAPELSALAHYEAALAHLEPADPDWVGLGAGPGPVRLCEGVVVLSVPVDVVELARNVDFGDVIWAEEQLQDVDGQPVPARPTWVVLVRDARGEPQILDLDGDSAAALLALGPGATLAVDPHVRAALEQHGVIKPTRWALDVGAAQGETTD